MPVMEPLQTAAAYSDSPSVMIPASSLHVGQVPVPLQVGHFSSSELRAVFRPVPKHCWHSPVPPQSLQRRRLPKITPSDIR